MKEPLTNLIPVVGRARVCLDLLKKQNYKDKVLVDVGSSFGWLEYEISDWGFKKIIGIEPKSAALKLARENGSKAIFLKGNASHLPVPNLYADIVALFDVIEHVLKGREKKVFNEIARTLKKGGILIFSTPNWHFLGNFLDPAWYFGHRHYRKKFITKMLEESGFLVNKSYIRGNLWSFIYLFWLYFQKHVLRIRFPRNKFLERMDDESFSKDGFHTIFLVAEKVHQESS